MSSACHAALMEGLGRQFSLSKSRLLTFAVLITSLCQSRTVNLTHLASHFPGPASHASTYRRLQRFFQFVRLDGDRMALMVVHMLNLKAPKCLALDRTNWKIGSRDINILMLAIVTSRFRVPLLWSLIPHGGTSNTTQRIALMQRYLRLFGASSIECLLADREFVGVRWMNFLDEHDIPFVIRVKEDMTLTLKNGRTWSLKTLVRHKRAKTRVATWQGQLHGAAGATTRSTQIAAKRLSGQWLIVITNRHEAKRALNLYRRRWAIECLFGDAKTRGLNLEDTRLRAAEKLDTLLILSTLAITWAYRCATRSMGRKCIARKTHGRRQKSWFRTGLDTLRRWIINDPYQAITAWNERSPKRLLSALKIL